MRVIDTLAQMRVLSLALALLVLPSGAARAEDIIGPQA